MAARAQIGFSVQRRQILRRRVVPVIPAARREQAAKDRGVGSTVSLSKIVDLF